MRFRMKTAREIQAMHETMAYALSLKGPEITDMGTAVQEMTDKSPAMQDAPATRSPLRKQFDASLYVWSEARPYEAERLSRQLAIWASAASEDVMPWTLIAERIFKITMEKNVVSTIRVRDRASRNSRATVPIKRETRERVVEWLFQSPTADEFMDRLTQRF